MVTACNEKGPPMIDNTVIEYNKVKEKRKKHVSSAWMHTLTKNP